MHTSVIPLLLAIRLIQYTPDTSRVITLQRDECYGSCPKYSVTLYANGRVRYEGFKFVKVTGTREYKIPIAAFDSLVQEFHRIRYFHLKDAYLEKVLGSHRDSLGNTVQQVAVASDLPTTITSIRLGKRYKRIIDYFGSPNSLKRLEELIDRLAMTAQFVKID
jgi:hypothetical protein